MQFELLNNNHHQNNLALYKCWNDDYLTYRKISLSRDSNVLIDNEKAGYNWFFSNLFQEDKTILTKNYFYEITVPEYRGNNPPYNYNFPQNTDIIKRVIKLYKLLWSNTEKFIIHGDFALNNIIYNSNSIYVIDWEHSHFSDESYYGFDIMHLIFLTLFERINRISDLEIDFLMSCYKSIIKDASTSNKIFEKPFVNTQRYLIEFSDKFKLNIPIENKFVLAKFPKSKLEELDLLIT